MLTQERRERAILQKCRGDVPALQTTSVTCDHSILIQNQHSGELLYTVESAHTRIDRTIILGIKRQEIAHIQKQGIELIGRRIHNIRKHLFLLYANITSLCPVILQTQKYCIVTVKDQDRSLKERCLQTICEEICNRGTSLRITRHDKNERKLSVMRQTGRQLALS